jgi:hypothetical protein
VKVVCSILMLASGVRLMLRVMIDAMFDAMGSEMRGNIQRAQEVHLCISQHDASCALAPSSTCSSGKPCSISFFGKPVTSCTQCGGCAEA